MQTTTTSKVQDVYKPLSFKKHVKLTSSPATNTSPFTPTFVASNLTQVTNPDELYLTRVRNRKLPLDNPDKEGRVRQERKERAERRKRANERKNKGKSKRTRGAWKNGFDLMQAKFELFIPLHHLWMGYISELLSLPQPSPSFSATEKDVPNGSSIHPKLVKADFHGSLLRVTQSLNPSLIGLSGIVILETENAFRVVTRKDQVKLIPKQNTIFTLALPLFSTLPVSHTPETLYQITIPPQSTSASTSTDAKGLAPLTVLDKPHIEMELYGNQFRFRAADRAGRKFKHKESIEL